MGLFGALRVENPAPLQIFASTLKVPLVFLLTLVVTDPSLYVWSALARSRLSSVNMLKLLLVGVVVNLALLSSFGPITGFFTLSTDSYTFMVLLDVLFFALSGAAGLVFLRRALGHALDGAEEKPSGDVSPEPPVSAPLLSRAGESSGFRARGVFLAWTVIYGVVGAQMGWILRPFIGSPDRPFSFFRERDSNFFEYLRGLLTDLFGI